MVQSAQKAADKNKPAAQNPTAKAQGLPDFSTWEDEQVGFPAYWTPTENAWFLAKCVARDDRGKDMEGGFVRFLMLAGAPTTCHKGSELGGNLTDHEVKAGEFFSISVYSSLEDLFNFYLESGIMPQIRVQALSKSKTRAGRTVWNWRVQTSPEDKKLLEAERVTRRQLAAASDVADFPPEQLEA